MRIGTAPGVGPIDGVTICGVRVRDAGTTPARINGQPGALITGVRISSVVIPDSSTPAGARAQLGITNVSNAGPVTVTA